MNLRQCTAALLSFAFVLSACGHRATTSSSKIVGGTPAETPGYMASLVDMHGYSSFCGGTFISPQVVVTAAHCVVGKRFQISVIPGLKTNENLTDLPQIPVAAVAIHPQFHRITDDNDIALLFLTSYDPSLFSPITPLSMNDNDDFPKAQQIARVMGFGNTTSYGTFFESNFQDVSLPIIANDLCQDLEGYHGKISSNDICAGDIEKGGKDSCTGDSGGPLVAMDGKGRDLLIGIISWGEGCARPKSPGVYTRVSRYRSWITQSLAEQAQLSSPLTPDKVAIAVDRGCYTMFATKQKIVDGSNTATIRLQYLRSSGFAAVDASGADLSHMTDISDMTPCMYHVGDLVFNTRMVLVDNGDSEHHLKPHFLVQESTTGAQFIATAAAQPSIEAHCMIDGKTMSLGTEGRYAQVDVQRYILQPNTDTPPESKPTGSCKIGDVILDFFGTGNTSSQASYTALNIRGGAFSNASLSYRLVPDVSIPPATISIVKNSIASGMLVVANPTAAPIYSWVLTCNFKATLTASNGVSYFGIPVPDTVAPAHDGMFQWIFRAASEPWSTIPDQGMIQFVLTDASTVQAGSEPAHYQCTLNHVPTILEINNAKT